jgi:Uma2 family endonuclease
MNWAEVCENPVLHNLPFKIELNQWGQILMSPITNRQGRWKSRVAYNLSSCAPTGDITSGCSVQTTKGVRVADVAWLSSGFVAKHADATPYPNAPELCVEINSPSNSAGEISEKVELYFEAGAKEVWLCDDGAMTFISPMGMRKQSKLFPMFPVVLH